jgi:murein DD-endopeptidase MepM/ murein hydrolase activator NlpD
VRPTEAEPRPTSWIRSRLLRGTVATLAIGSLAVGLSHVATPSAAAPVPQPTIGSFELSAMEARDKQLSRDADARAQGPQALAQSRTIALNETAQELAESRQDAALKIRTKALDAVADKISRQSKLLTDQSHFLMPTAGGFDTRFGPRLHPILHYYKLHNGDDIGGACGQPIWAAHDGVVIKAAMGGYNGGSGNNVRIDAGKIGKHAVESAYLHMTSIAVQVGQKVHKGELLGTVGSTGLSTACHLHFSVYEDGKAVAPKKYLGK